MYRHTERELHSTVDKRTYGVCLWLTLMMVCNHVQHDQNSINNLHVG